MAYIMRKDEMEFNLNHDRAQDYMWMRSGWLSEMADAKQMDAVVVSLTPDKFSYPYHFHYGTEELFVILSGSALLRTPEGVEEVVQGDVIFFEMGKNGAHQLYNHTDEPCVYLDLGTNADINLCEYPDTGKINAYGKEVGQIHYKSNKVDYFEGEENVREKWKDKI
jgi:uncharacterized cupin superfamily protein